MVAIVGMVLVIALPFFGVVARRSRVYAEAMQVYAPMLKARLQAVKRGNNVFVEISTDPSKASYRTPTIFVDSGSTPNEYDTTDTLIGAFPTAPSSQTTIAIDDANKASPASSSTTVEYIFTPLGSMSAASTTKSVYVSDVKGNVVQISVPSGTTGKPAMTKLLGSAYVAPPWKWY